MEHNPYLAARGQMQNGYLDLCKHRRNWQMTAACFALLSLILAATVYSLHDQATIVPYVVEVDHLGNVRAVGQAERDQSGFPARESVIRAELTHFLRNARSVIIDPIALKAALDDVYAHAQGAARELLNSHFQTHDPFERAQTVTVTASIKTILPLSENSFQLKWQETERDLTGAVLAQSIYEAVLTIRLSPPTDAETVRTNPLGLYVVALSWDKAR